MKPCEIKCEFTPGLQNIHITGKHVLYRCPPNVCLQDGNSTCASGHKGPLCSICIPGFAMQSGKCRECTSLSVWPQVIVAILACLVFIFLFFFSWFPLLPEWLHNKLSFATTRISTQSGEQSQKRNGQREAFGEQELKDDASGALSCWGFKVTT
jgi:hypothetical protein